MEMDSKKKKNWVDFKAIKERVSMEMILNHYQIELKKSGKNLVGPCPIHKGSEDRQFSVDPEKNIFNCFSDGCGAKGNVLDFVALIEFDDKEMGSIRKAALRIREWFPESGSSEQGNESEEVLKKLLDDLGERYDFKDDIEVTISALKLLRLELEKRAIIKNLIQIDNPPA